MELLKSIVIDFVLFSGVEGFIFCLFFEKIGGCRKFKWYEWLVLSIGNCVISQVFPPTIYQIICVVYMSIIVKLLNKNKRLLDTIKYSIWSVMLAFVVEVIGSIIIEILFRYDRFSCIGTNNIFTYIAFIVLKIIELYIIYIWLKLKKEGQ